MSFWRRKNLNNCQKKTCKPKRDSSLRFAAFRMTVEFLLRFVRNDGACHSDEGRISRIVKKRLVNQKEILHSAPLRSEWQTTYYYEPWYWLNLRLSFWRRKNLNSCQKKTCKPKRDSSLRSAAFRMTVEFLLRFVRNIGACHSDEGRISTIVRKRLVNQKEILHSAPLRSEWQRNFCCVLLGMTTLVILTKEESQQLSEKDL